MIMTKDNCKKAMTLNHELAAKLCYKAEMVANLTDRINGLKRFAPECVGSIQHAHGLRKQIQIEMLQILGALAGEFKRAYGQNLFSEFVNYKNYEKLTGEDKVKTVAQMCELLRTADECCREVWADYLQAEGDAYLCS